MKLLHTALKRLVLAALVVTVATPVLLAQAPSAPVLKKPTNNATGVLWPIKLEWDKPTTGAFPFTYHLQVATDPNFANLVLNPQNLPEIASTHGGSLTEIFPCPNGALCPGTQYWWRVRATNSSGTSGWSSGWTFTTGGCVTPTAPTNLAPVGPPAQDPGFKFTWSAPLTGSTPFKYDLQVATSNAFSTLVIDEQVNTNQRTVQGYELGPNKTYYWRVRTVNACGTSPWSAGPTNFVTSSSPGWTGGSPSVPALAGPPNGSSNLHPPVTLSWSPSTGASPITYRLQVAKNSSFSNSVLDKSGLVGTSYTLVKSDLEDHTTYYWRVRGENAFGSSAWPSEWMFTTSTGWGAPPQAPSNLSPCAVTVDSDQQVCLSWSAPTGAGLVYDLELSYDASYLQLITYSYDFQGTQWCFAPNYFNAGATVYWRVRAQNAAGVSAWTQCSFDTSALVLQPGVVQSIGPQQSPLDFALTPFPGEWNAVGISSTSNWDLALGFQSSALGGSSCDYLVANGHDGSIAGAAGMASLTSGSTTAYLVHSDVDALAVGVNPDRLMVYNQSVQLWEFTALADGIHQITVLSDLPNSAARFAWWHSNGSSAWRARGEVSEYAIGTTIARSLSQGEVYALIVSRDAGAGFAEDIGVTVTSPPQPPSPPTPVSPCGAQVTSTTPTLQWNAPVNGVGPFSYSVELSDDASFSSPHLWSTSTTALNAAVPAGILSASADYWWHVEASNAAGSSGWSAACQFQTQGACVTPGVPGSLAPDGGEFCSPFVLSWSPVSGTAPIDYEVEVACGGTQLKQTTTATSIALTAPVDGPVNWQVRARNACGDSAWAVASFCASNLPTQPDGLIPCGVVGVPVTPTLRWNGVFDTCGTYDYEVATDPAFVDVVAHGEGLAGTSCPVTLAAGESYYWHVRSVNVCGQSSWSPSCQFDTLAASICLVPNISGIDVSSSGGSAPASVSLELVHCGVSTSAIDWAYSKNNSVPADDSWLVVSPPSGTIPSGSAGCAITVGFQVAGLPVGPYTTTLHSYNTADPAKALDLPVTLHVGNVVPVGPFEFRASTVLHTGSSTTLSGSIEIGVSGQWLLSVVAPKATIDWATETVQFVGRVDTLTPLPSLVLFDGKFESSFTQGKLELIGAANDALSKWKPAGLAVNIDALDLFASPEPGVRVAGRITLPQQLENEDGDPIGVDIDASIALSGVKLAKGCLDLGDGLNIAGATWTIDDACVDYDSTTDTLHGSATVDLNETTVAATLDIVHGQLAGLSVQVDTLVPLPPLTPNPCADANFGLTHIGIDAQGLNVPGNLSLEGSAGFAALPGFICLAGIELDVVEAYPLALRYDSGGLWTFSGDVAAFVPVDPIHIQFGDFAVDWVGYPLAHASARYGPNCGFEVVDAWLDLFDVVKAQIDRFQISPQLQVLGHATGVIKLPSSLPLPFGGLQLAAAEATMDDASLRACSNAFGAQLCVVVRNEGGVSFVVNWGGLGSLAGPPVPGSGDLLAFDVAASTSEILAGCVWTSGNDDFLLTAPSGEVFSTLGAPPAGALVQKDDAQQRVVFTVFKPEVGTWHLSSVLGVVTGAETFAWQRNAAPSVKITAPAAQTAVFVGGEFALQIEAYDPDDVAAVHLRLARAVGEFTGPTLATNVATEQDGSVDILAVVPEGIEPGDYRLVAVLDDGKNTPVAAFGPVLTVVDPALPDSPRSVTYSIAGDHVEIAFEPGAGALAETYRVEYAPVGADLVKRSAVALGPGVLSAQLRVSSELMPGADYVVNVVPISPDGRSGVASKEVMFTAPGDAHGSAPRLAQAPSSMATPAASALGPGAWSTHVRVADADKSDHVMLTIEPRADLGLSLPTGMAPPFEVEPGLWRIELLDPSIETDSYPLVLVLTDQFGHVERVDWLLHVLAPESGNAPPEILSVPPFVATSVGGAYLYELIAGDEQPSALTWELVDGPAFVEMIGSAIRGSPVKSDQGEHSVTVRVVDAFGASATQTFSLFVDPTADSHVPKPSAGGGGGCSIDPNGGSDWSLPLALGLAVLWLLVRGRMRR